MPFPIDFKREGDCNRCGKCCVALIDWRMTKQTPETGIKRNVPCMFLEGEVGVFTTCLIRSGKVSLDDVTDFQRKYYLTECILYPDPNDEAHWDKSMQSGCSFSRQKIEEK